MRKLIASLFTTVDGFTAGPKGDMGWVMNSFNDEMGKYAGDLQASMDTIVLGRVTYQLMTGYWPTAGSDVPGADRMNGVPKIVVSGTLGKAEWGTYNNARLVKDNVAAEITKLKQQAGGPMVIYGSATLVRSFLRLGLIDELQLLVHPFVMGGGTPLFKDMEKPVALVLGRAQSFKNGVVLCCYHPVRPAA